MRNAIIIGSGIGGLATACLLAKQGYQVQVLEKNESLGGRASVFEAQGYRFDMGPSWYLMPDVFAHFFSLLGEDVNQLLQLQKLAPSYRIFFKDTEKQVDFYSDLKKDLLTVESLEKGAAQKLQEYLAISAHQYEIAKQHFMYRNYDHWWDFLNFTTFKEGRKLSVVRPMDSYVRKFFSTPEMQKIIQYQLVFLGSSPYNTPALYNIMNHIDFNMGVFYPKGGIYEIINVLVKLAEKMGVRFSVNSPVEKIVVESKKATGVMVAGKRISADLVISNADMTFTEQTLLDPEHRSYSKKYWDSRVMAPSALIMYLGVKGRIPNLVHHNLIFSQDWQQNFADIFDHPVWPADPSLYVSAPSKTDDTVAPKGNENLCILIPIAAGLTYDQSQLEQYADKTLTTLSQVMKVPDLKERIEYKRMFCVQDFAERYNSFRGTALGLAHTLKQTALFRPNNVSKKVQGLYYVGGGTNPGIGMPICLISAEMVYKRIMGIQSPEPLSSLEATNQ